jgi:hypothetical protein
VEALFLPMLFAYAPAMESFPSVPARAGMTACTTEPPLVDSTTIFPPKTVWRAKSACSADGGSDCVPANRRKLVSLAAHALLRAEDRSGGTVPDSYE